MALASGATFAGYTVARRLGSGATGDVYLVQDPRSSRWLALKVLSPPLSTDRDFRRRFRVETPIATNLYYPHIVAVHDRGEFEDQPYIVMEYVEGITAVRLMADRFPAVSPAGEALAILTDIAGALDYAHQRGLLHRDVKPANILLTDQGRGEQRILLADFGIAPPAGTVAYAAPEQLMGADTDGRADQYALAATVFHLLTGAPPVEHSDPAAALRQLLDDAPPRLSDQRPELARLDGVFAAALAKRPADRFGTCSEFAEAANEQAGVSTGDRSPEAVLVAEYPAYARPGIDDVDHIESAAKAQPAVRNPETLRPAAGALARRLDDFSTTPREPAPGRRLPGNIVVGAAAAVLFAGLLAVGFVAGRKTDTTAAPAARPTTSASAAPTASTPAAAPVPLDGTYRLEIQRTKQTFDYTPDPQPPDVTTWWAFRSSCTPGSCTAVGVLLDDGDHTQAKSSDGEPVVLDFRDGRWLARPEKATFPCIGLDGVQATHATTQVLSLRPQPRGEFAGEMTVTVQSNECVQQGAVLRAPAVAIRDGDVPPGVTVPDPAVIPESPTAPSGPHR
ncbi:serine/threonine protein kinase [Mycobacterium malmoense]|uniref:non-specific serine/threonine protein kinase n=3 Tax=Mycobacterium malmoense TaxID=1780 RepID=A0ABX3SU78_MYCMA|nr:serine/threonine-protein kinase [Mycobacterium malmoense]ORA84095.1 serine/threonine protein kinase [Mycobacterium malmoense]QZA19050.1 serine/threonine protein kinase [Mycobacterium malmoense]UNB95814.1 serine/threonine protein kinase [Mycobacterium malmoense]